MQTIVHLSDLHFGRVDREIVAAVVRSVSAMAPRLVAVSGDLTQRARRSQFKEARSFLDALPAEKIVVPGNHDVPLWNLIARFGFPLANYRRYITGDLSPLFDGSEFVVAGINTARSLTWKRGRINVRQAETVRTQLCRYGESVMKIVVTHHPFDPGDAQHEGEIVRRARMAMEVLASCGADVLLAGHIHEAFTGGTARRYKISGHSALVVQAGTATSTRLRRSPNSFNVLLIDPPQITVKIMSWDKDAHDFIVSETKRYGRRAGVGFERIDEPPADAVG
jgi:3',5'-cyclic AMP phosphodiesterase CpdA